MKGSVIVTDAEERAALGACRGLTRAGYRVCAVSRLSPAATHWSRACAERVRLPDPRESVHAFVDGLGALLQRSRYDALIPGSDASVLAVSENRGELEPFTRLGLPSREVVRRVVDKVVLLDAAAAVGLASPASRSCADVEEAEAAAAELGFPVVVKPVQSFAPVNGGLQQRGVSIADDSEALAEAVRDFASPFIVQRFERAQFLSCTGVFADGRLLALTTSRVPRLWPPIAGMHAYSETVTPPDGLPARVRELLGSLGWQGIFQLQLLELADRLAVIDLNPRVFASILLDADAGANLAAVWVDWLLGRDPAPVTARPAMRYRWEEGELCHFAWQLRHRRLRAAARVLRPHRRVTHAWFRASDPGPLIARGLNLVVGRRAYRRAA
jgi:predicted ATP-grasp superfamily ATP-dependent carboligase